VIRKQSPQEASKLLAHKLKNEKLKMKNAK
jgi:hypothetical protein